MCNKHGELWSPDLPAGEKSLLDHEKKKKRLFVQENPLLNGIKI